MLLTEDLEGSRALLGNEHEDTLISMTNLGRFLLKCGRLDEASTLLRESLSARRKVLGDLHADTLEFTTETNNSVHSYDLPLSLLRKELIFSL